VWARTSDKFFVVAVFIDALKWLWIKCEYDIRRIVTASNRDKSHFQHLKSITTSTPSKEASQMSNGTNRPQSIPALIESNFLPQHVGTSRRHRATQMIAPVIEHMLRHLNQSLRVPALSAMAGVSDSHFFTLFKSATGYAPLEFHTHLRMEYACKLLVDDTRTIRQIAESLGYLDRFYFSRVFKSVIGMAPRNYRRKIIRSGRLPLRQRYCQNSQNDSSNLQRTFAN
jgi:AraC-like DNA-binding protein